MRSKTTKNIIIFYSLSALTFFSLALFTNVVPPKYAESWLLWFNYIAILSSISALKYESSIVIGNGGAKSVYLLIISILLCLTINSCLCMVLFFLNSFSILEITILQLLLVALISILSSISIVLAHFQLSIGKYNDYTFIILIPPSLTSLIQIIAFTLGFKSQSSFLLSAIASYGLIFLFAVLRVRKDINYQIFKNINIKRLKVLLVKRRNYAFYSTPLILAGLARDRFIFAILATISNPVTISLVILAQRLIEFSYAAISRPIRPIFFKMSVEYGIQFTTAKVPLIIRNITLIILPLWLLIVVNANYLFEHFLGSEWVGAVPYFIILSPSAFIISTTLWLDKTYDILGYQKKLFALELIFSVILIIGLSAYRIFDSDPIRIVSIMGFINFVYSIAWLLTTFKLLNLKYNKLATVVITQFLILIIYLLLAIFHRNHLYNYLMQFVITYWFVRAGLIRMKHLSLKL